MKISSKEEFEKLNVFGTGTANTAYAKYFIGDSFLNPLTKAEVNSLSVPQARAGIRNTARPQ